jgi:hypothetical protein
MILFRCSVVNMDYSRLAFTMVRYRGVTQLAALALAPEGAAAARAAADCSAALFPLDMSGVQCKGLTQADMKGAGTPDACRQACCDGLACNVWQW